MFKHASLYQLAVRIVNKNNKEAMDELLRRCKNDFDIVEHFLEYHIEQSDKLAEFIDETNRNEYRKQETICKAFSKAAAQLIEE